MFNDIDMLLIAEKGIRDWIYHAIHQYTKANNKYMKGYESLYSNYWNVAW